jgi:hypothetical protein
MQEQLIDALYTLRTLLRDEQYAIDAVFKDLRTQIVKQRKKTIAEIIAENYPASLDDTRNTIRETAEHITELYQSLRAELVPEVLLPAVDALFEHPERTCEDILTLHNRKVLFPKIGMSYRGFRLVQYAHHWAQFHVDDQYVLTRITVEPFA